MLSVLKIKNLALVEDLTWELGSGLVCVTGETGAGKSIIVGALIIVFLIVEPHGLARLWRIAKEKLRLWPFPH